MYILLMAEVKCAINRILCAMIQILIKNVCISAWKLVLFSYQWIIWSEVFVIPFSIVSENMYTCIFIITRIHDCS